jgi:hypothetical protein
MLANVQTFPRLRRSRKLDGLGMIMFVACVMLALYLIVDFLMENAVREKIRAWWLGKPEWVKSIALVLLAVVLSLFMIHSGFLK